MTLLFTDPAAYAIYELEKIKKTLDDSVKASREITSQAPNAIVCGYVIGLFCIDVRCALAWFVLGVGGAGVNLGCQHLRVRSKTQLDRLIEIIDGVKQSHTAEPVTAQGNLEGGLGVIDFNRLHLAEETYRCLREFQLDTVGTCKNDIDLTPIMSSIRIAYRLNSDRPSVAYSDFSLWSNNSRAETSSNYQPLAQRMER